MPNKQANKQSTKMKHTTRQDLKFNQSMNILKKTHPHISVKAPRNKKDRNPPPHMNKENWVSKSEKEIFQMDIQFLQNVEDNHFTCWRQFKAHLKRVLNNPTMKINIWIVEKNDLISVPHNIIQ